MRVSLINPAMKLTDERESVGVDPKMPMGLLYLAAACESRGHDVQVVDAALQGEGVSWILRQLRRHRPELVGITSLTVTKSAVLELARLSKSLLDPTPIVVVGGVQATLMPESFFAEPAVDFVVAGEGERVLPDLCQRQMDGAPLPGVFYRVSDGNMVQWRPPERIADLDDLAPPAFHLLDLSAYLRSRDEICLTASRGCPYACSFCCAPTMWGGRITFRSPSHVVCEMKQWLTSHPIVRRFHFLDDNFTLRRDWLMEFCSEAGRLTTQWRCIGRVDHLDRCSVAAMSDSGCTHITFGVETGSRRLQESCGKRLDLDALPARVRWLSEEGIRSKAFFMFGFPDETEVEMQDTIRYAISLKEAGLQDVAFVSLIPYPGTQVYSELCGQHGSSFGDADGAMDWLADDTPARARLAKYRTFPVVSANPQLSGLQLRLLTHRAYALFFEGADQEAIASEVRRVVELPSQPDIRRG